MNFLKRIRNIARAQSKSGSKETPYEPVEQTPAKEQAPKQEQITVSGDTDDRPELSPVRERLDRLKTLTPREREVYGHLIRGRKMREIAKLMGVTYATVNFHCKGLYKKLCINTRAQLFIQYATLGAADAEKTQEEKA
jgi:DNA-binding NarL/FixJ family response regulator